MLLEGSYHGRLQLLRVREDGTGLLSSARDQDGRPYLHHRHQSLLLLQQIGLVFVFSRWYLLFLKVGCRCSVFVMYDEIGSLLVDLSWTEENYLAHLLLCVELLAFVVVEIIVDGLLKLNRLLLILCKRHQLVFE